MSENKCTHLVIKSSGQSRKWEKGCLMAREAPSQESKSQQEREGNTAHWLSADGAHGHEVQWGPVRERMYKKKGKQGMKESWMKFSPPENSGKEIEIPRQRECTACFILVDPIPPHTSVRDASEMVLAPESSAINYMFVQDHAHNRTLASGYYRNIFKKNKQNKPVIGSGIKSLKMERNGG